MEFIVEPDHRVRLHVYAVARDRPSTTIPGKMLKASGRTRNVYLPFLIVMTFPGASSILMDRLPERDLFLRMVSLSSLIFSFTFLSFSDAESAAVSLSSITESLSISSVKSLMSFVISVNRIAFFLSSDLFNFHGKL